MITTYLAVSLIATSLIAYLVECRFGALKDGLHPRRYTRQTGTGCSKEEFRCRNGQCISQYDVCDGTANCVDYSDETKVLCRSIKCDLFLFQCEYGACIESSMHCDNITQCADGSDEKGCNHPKKKACSAEEYNCENGECISKYDVCDGSPQCTDGSDETAIVCSTMVCPFNTFQCAYGACIDSVDKCNNVLDCVDGSDEDAKLCQPTLGSTTQIVNIRYPTVATTTQKPHSASTGDAGSCTLPPNAVDKTFTVNCMGSACQSSHGRLVSPFTTITIRCNEGFTHDQPTMQAFCLNGAWQPNIIDCYKICDKLNPVDVELRCTYRGEEVDCGGTLRAGTRVRPYCKPSYRQEYPVNYREMVCRSNGQWDQTLFRCIPECGKPLTTPETLIVKGQPAKYGDSPWHVAIYDKTASYLLICGGTIITPYLVVSAAHCFYDRADDMKRNAIDYQIMVSKISRNNSAIDNPQTKAYDLNEIWFPEKGYHGVLTNHASDIALLEINEKIILSPAVLPACIEWTRVDKYKPPEGTPGKVVGWGIDDSGSVYGSDHLLAATLPYISYETCLRRVPEGFRQYITLDKFCAGSENGAGVRQGDSGGGYLRQIYDLYYLYGIVSIKDSSETSIAAFTDVIEHLDWINKVRSNLERKLIADDTTLPMKHLG